MAPEIRTARYILGATVCPELPTWRSIGSQPESQIGRDAASSAPSTSASFCTTGLLAASLIPRAPQTQTLARGERTGLHARERSQVWEGNRAPAKCGER